MRKHLLAFAVIMVMLLTACTPAADPVDLSIGGIRSRDYFYNTYASEKRVENFPKDMITWDAVAKLGTVAEFRANGDSKNLAAHYSISISQDKYASINILHDPSIDQLYNLVKDQTVVSPSKNMRNMALGEFATEGNCKIVLGNVSYHYVSGPRPEHELNFIHIHDGNKVIRVSFGGDSPEAYDAMRSNPATKDHILLRLLSISEDEATAAAKELCKVLNSEPLSKTLNKN